MKAMFVNEDGVKYAQLIVSGKKLIETRTKNMLLPLVGERVASGYGTVFCEITFSGSPY